MSENPLKQTLRKKMNELTRVSRTLQNGIILPEEVSNGKASDLQ